MGQTWDFFLYQCSQRFDSLGQSWPILGQIWLPWAYNFSSHEHHITYFSQHVWKQTGQQRCHENIDARFGHGCQIWAQSGWDWQEMGLFQTGFQSRGKLYWNLIWKKIPDVPFRPESRRKLFYFIDSIDMSKIIWHFGVLMCLFCFYEARFIIYFRFQSSQITKFLV